MIKTNSRQAKQKVKAFINSIFDASGYEREELNESSIEEKIHFIAEIFWKEKRHDLNRKTYQEAFIDWCEGLPSLIDTASYYCYNSAVEILGDILEETNEEKAKYDEMQAEKMLSYLIYKEVADDIFKVAF